MITIDGKKGEGGGQVLRTCLALSLVTGKPFTIENIRGKRKKPGMLRQHYTAAMAAAAIGDAEISDAEVGATRLEFSPEGIHGGDYQFAVGSAGSATLVLQTILPALLAADKPSHVVLEGGTHNPMAPPVHFSQATLLPCLEKMGVGMNVSLERMGFFPAGGGRFTVDVEPVSKWRRFELLETGERKNIQAKAYLSQIPEKVGYRELKVLQGKLNLADEDTEIVEVTDSIGPGNALTVEIESENVTETITGFGERGVTAERVAHGVAKEVLRYFKAEAPVGEHLADQLMVPLAMGAGGTFRTLPPSSHLKTVADVIREFLDVQIDMRPTDGIAWEVEVTPS